MSQQVLQPIKYIFDRTDQESQALVGTARRAMMILESLMAFQGLEQYSYSIEPYPGALIICSKVFGSRQIRILTGGKRRKVRLPQEECICTCNFTTGFIFEVEADNLDKDGANVTPLYTVLACIGKRAYRIFEHTLASDFTKYEEGQKVVLIPYQGMSYLCCGTPAGPTGCRPQKSEVDISHDDWRTTYRIIPWCGLKIPKWLRR